jgi:hypothetical protein
MRVGEPPRVMRADIDIKARRPLFEHPMQDQVFALLSVGLEKIIVKPNLSPVPQLSTQRRRKQASESRR